MTIHQASEQKQSNGIRGVYLSLSAQAVGLWIVAVIISSSAILL